MSLRVGAEHAGEASLERVVLTGVTIDECENSRFGKRTSGQPEVEMPRDVMPGVSFMAATRAGLRS